MSQTGEKGEKICSGQGFFKYNSTMNFTFPHKYWFKVTINPFFISFVYSKYKPIRAKLKVDMLKKKCTSDMTFSLNLQTLFKVTPLSLTIDSM